MPRKVEQKREVKRIEDKLDIFTGRKEPQEIVNREFDRIKADLSERKEERDFKILNFYGLGGLGKSFLAEKVKQNLKEKHPENHKPFIMWDANGDNNLNYNMVEVLRMLRNLIVKYHDFDFTEFDNYLVHYKAQNGEKVQLTEFEGGVSKTDSKETMKVVLDTVIQAAGIVSPISLFDTFKNSVKNKKKLKESQQILGEIDGISMQDRVATLKDKFVSSYNAAIAKSKEPMVIFIDTFEDFNLSSDWLLSGERDEVFGYGLCQSMAGTLWVISGRDKLPYEPSKETEDLEHFEFFQLNEFSKGDTLYFWKTFADSENSEFAERIWKETEGHPLLLGIYHDIYRHQMEENIHISLDDFFKEQVKGQKNKALIERYLRYLEKDSNTQSDKSLGQLIRLLACLGTWSYEEEKDWPESLRKYISGERSDLFTTIYRKTLVLSNGDNSYRLDRTVKEILLNESNKGEPLISDFMKKDVFNYLVEKSKKTSLSDEHVTQIIKLAKLLNESAGEHFYNAVFDGLSVVFYRLTEERNFTKFMSLYIRVLNECSTDFLNSKMGKEKISDAINLADEYSVYEVAETLELLVERVSASPELLASLGQFYIKEGNINRAEKVLSKGVGVSGNSESDEVHFELAYGMYQIEQVRQNIDKMGAYLRVLQDLTSSIGPFSYWIIYHTALLSFLQSVRETERANELIEEFDEKWARLPEVDKAHYLKQYSQFERVAGLVFNQSGQYEEALKRFYASKEGIERTLGKDSHDYWHILDNEAETHRFMNDLETAYEKYEEIYINRYRIHGMNNHYTIRAVLNYDAVLNKREDYSKSIELLEEAIKAAENILPKNHRLFGKLYNNLADAYKNNKQYNHAIDNYLIALQEKNQNPQFEKHEIIRDEIKLNEAAFCLALENSNIELAENVWGNLKRVVFNIKNALNYYMEQNRTQEISFLEDYYLRMQNLEKQIDSFLNTHKYGGRQSSNFKSRMDIVLFLPIRFSDGDQSLHAIYKKDDVDEFFAFCIDYYKNFIGFRFRDQKLSPDDLERVLLQKDAEYCENTLDYNYIEKFENFDVIIERLSLFEISSQGEKLKPKEIVQFLIK